MNIVYIAIACAAAINIENANLFRSTVTVICQTGSADLSKLHCHADITIRKFFTSNTSIILSLAVGIKVEVTIYALDPSIRISQKHTDAAAIGQLIVKCQAFIGIFCQIDKFTIITGKGIAAEGFHIAGLYIINIAFSGSRFVNINQGNRFRRTVTVVNTQRTVQFIQVHSHMDITVFQRFTSNAGLCTIGNTIGIKIINTVVFDPFRSSQDNGHCAFRCKLIVKADLVILLFCKLNESTDAGREHLTMQCILSYIFYSFKMILIHSAQQLYQCVIAGGVVHTANVIHGTICHLHLVFAIADQKLNFLGIILRIDAGNFYIV